MQWKVCISFETALVQKTVSNPKEIFGHLQRDSRLRIQISTLKESKSEPITDPNSQAKTFADRFRDIQRLDTGKPTPTIHREAHPIPPLQIETDVVQHVLASLNHHKGQRPDSIYPAVLKAIATPSCQVAY